MASTIGNLDYREIFEQGNVLYLILAPDSPRFTILGASDAYLQATRRSREELVGRGIFEAFPENPDDTASKAEGSVRASIEQVLSTHAPHRLPVQKYDVPKPESEGGGYEVKYWSAVHFPVFGKGGELIHIAQRVEDITELAKLQNQGVEQSRMNEELRQRAGQMEMKVLLRAQEVKEANLGLVEANKELDRRGKELQSLYDKLKELDLLKTQFFANISHEFRTPLALMLGPLEDFLAGRRGVLPPSLRDEIEVIQRNATRLLKLVNALLDFSRIEAGRAQVKLEPTDLAQLTAELASAFRSAVESTGLQLVVETDPLPAAVYVDRGMWEKIVLNLISNAFKFTLQGEIAVRLRPVEDRIELTVSDTGCGIPQQELPRMFERFHRVEGARGRSFEGSGLGLSLVNEFAKLHGGSVHVASVEGKGSTFTVSIPIRSGQISSEQAPRNRSASQPTTGAMSYTLEAMTWIGEAEGGTNAAGESAVPPAPTTDKSPVYSDATVLVVDDNPDMRCYLMRIISEYCRVEIATDGEAALAKARTTRPDLVLTDVMMPKLDGFGLLRALRADPQTREIPIVILSARAGEESLLEGIETGADDYLIKPFSARELLARVRTHLNMARLRREWAAELERANAELEAFSYSVSHDLRAPLRRISGFAEMLREHEGARLNEKSRHYVDTIINSVKKMESLINDLLLFSRMAKTEMCVGKVRFDTLLQEVIQELQSDLQGREMIWKIHPLPEVEGDRAMLRQVWANLIWNAVKYTRTRQRAEIDIGQRSDEREYVFYVRDNGVGFDPQYIDKLFGVFQRLHREDEFEGTGIGLANVRRIVHRHRGRTWAEGALDQGATFYFSLPKNGKDLGSCSHT